MCLQSFLFVVNAIIILSLFHPQPDDLELIIELAEHIAFLESKDIQLATINETEADDVALKQQEPEQGVTLKEALLIPGVLSYGFSFFCVKFAVYALLLWLPLFLTNELKYDNNQIANMQSAIEIGNLFGGAVLGLISDYCYSKRAPAGVFAVVASFLIMFNLTWSYKTISSTYLAGSLGMIGLLLGGLHHLLCVTCAADLG